MGDGIACALRKSWFASIEFVAGGNLGVRAFEFVTGAVLGYLA